VPWIATLATDGGVTAAADAGGTADAGAATGSGCVPVPPDNPFSSLGTPGVACAGNATARGTGNDVMLVFADGSTLRWDTSVTEAVISPPVVADGARVWVDFSRRTSVVCPVCGSFQTTLLQIRAGSSTGPLIWIGRESVAIAEIGADLVSELFGVGAHEQVACQEAYTAGCFDVTRQQYDHILETSPAQVIPAASRRHITTSKGEYDVFWAHSTQQSVQQTLCFDGPAVGSDDGFAASRTSGPVTP